MYLYCNMFFFRFAARYTKTLNRLSFAYLALFDVVYYRSNLHIPFRVTSLAPRLLPWYHWSNPSTYVPLAVDKTTKLKLGGCGIMTAYGCLCITVLHTIKPCCGFEEFHIELHRVSIDIVCNTSALQSNYFSVESIWLGNRFGAGRSLMYQRKQAVQTYNGSRDLNTCFCFALLCCGYGVLTCELQWSIHP